MAARPELVLSSSNAATARHVEAGAEDKVARPDLRRLLAALQVSYGDKDGTKRLFAKTKAALHERRWTAAPPSSEEKRAPSAQPSTAAGPPKRRATSSLLHSPSASSSSRPPPPPQRLPLGRAGQLGRMPTTVLGNVVALLDDADVAAAQRTTRADAVGVALALADRARLCVRATRRGEDCADILRSYERYAELDVRCRAQCWQAVRLQLARGMALWQSDSADDRSEADARYRDDRIQLEFEGPFSEQPAGSGAFERTEGGHSGPWTCLVSYSKRNLYLQVEAELTLRDLIGITNDARVRAAVADAQEAFSDDPATHRSRDVESPGWLDDKTPSVDFLWNANRYERGVVDVIDPGYNNDGDVVRCGYAPGVRAAALDACIARLRPRPAPTAAAAGTPEYAARVRAAKTLRTLVAQVRAAAVAGALAGNYSPDVMVPYFVIGPAPSAYTSRLDLPMDVLFVLHWSHDVHSKRADDDRAVNAEIVSRVVPVLLGSYLFPRELALQWLDWGGKDYADAKVWHRVATGAVANYRVASADAPPILPIEDAAKPITPAAAALQVAAASPSALLYYAGLRRATPLPPNIDQRVVALLRATRERQQREAADAGAAQAPQPPGQNTINYALSHPWVEEGSDDEDEDDG